MPRLRRQSPESLHADVPVELRSRLHPVWLDPRAVRKLCERLGVVASGVGPLTRFQAVAGAYGVARGLTSDRWPDRPHAGKLSRAGIPMFSCFLIAAEEHPTVFDHHELTDADWEFIASAEARILSR